MPLADPSLERVSACPVHFIWDGRGIGRVLVRSGFLGLLAAAMLAAAGRMVHMESVMAAALVIAATAGVVWLAGQGASWRAVRRFKLAR